MSRCLQSQESVVGSSHTARPPASVSSSCRQDNKSVTTPKTRPAASAVTQVKAQWIFVEVLTGFETFARSSAPRRSFLPFRELSCGYAPTYWHVEAVFYVSFWSNIEVHAMSYRRIMWSAVVKLMVRGARQTSKVYEDDGYGTASVLHG
jgi:hypothetical protein